MIGIAMIFSVIMKIIESSMKKISTALFFREKFLNFKEKRGISAFIKTLKSSVIAISTYLFTIKLFIKTVSLYVKITGKESIKRVIAGVGKPINDEV